MSILLISCNQVTNGSEESPKNNSKTDSHQTTVINKQENKKQSNPVAPAEKLPKSIISEVSQLDIQKLHDQLKTLTQDLSCDNSTQCQVEAVGSRACGGPSSYLVYSSKSAATETVKQVTTKITQYESTYNAKNNMVSICQHLTRPAAQCVASKCVKLENSSQETF